MENLTSRPVTVTLNSGAVVHLPPGHAIEPEPVELQDNAKVQKLRDALVIAVTEADDGADDSAKDGEPAEVQKPTKARPRRQPSA